MKYGLPYQGSKNKLAERIVRLLPKRTHLIDLSCGGCAASPAALLMGKYEHIHINDLHWMCPTLFIDALTGKYNHENRWIRRHDLSFIDPIQDLQKRYLAVKHYFNRLDKSQQQSFEGGRIRGCSQSKQKKDSIPFRISSLGKAVKSSLSKKKYKRPSELQHNEGRNTVASLAIPRAAAQSAQIFGGQILPITSSVLDYEEVTIPEDSVIYCDIPYEGTDGYLEKDKGGFDYERFYQWCERQTQPVFISSYQMPEDRFDCIEEFTHRSTFAQKYNNLVTERIYVPKHQAERGNRIVQLTLF